MDVEIAYNQALDYLYSFVDYSLKHTSELVKADFNLERMRDLMAMLGDPQYGYPIVHVAGTKGKGSTAAMIASALNAAGYRAGLYISPHLQDFCERIQVAGEPIPHGDLAELVEEIKPHVARIPFITTFELTTALGFFYFAKRGVNAAAIEVGLGGRLDATNVLTPLVSVITSLSYDHMAVLGDTLAKIAAEKAGIIKEGKPVVSSPQKDEALQVLERVARQRRAPLTLVGRDIFYEPGSHSLDGQSLRAWTRPGRNATELRSPSTSLRSAQGLELTIPLLGAHQAVNAATAYAALVTARRFDPSTSSGRGLEVPDAAIREGLAAVSWPGRFEVLRREPPVILDSAHNTDSAEKLRQTLDDYFPGQPVTLIFGASEDKDVLGMFNAWKPRLGCIVATKADHPRALDPEALIETATRIGVPAEVVKPVEAAFARALQLAEKDGSIVLSAGSVFVTAEARTAWQKRMNVYNVQRLSSRKL